MPLSKDWSEWWRRFLDLALDESANVVDFLRQRYVEEMQRIERFKQHAEKMHYPQYREKFLQIAKEKSQHAERIGEKIIALGSILPDVAEGRSTDENSWKSLLMALEDENRSADHLTGELRRIGHEHPDITEFLQDISQKQKKHRDEIRAMMMRSDSFAFSLA